MGAGGAIWLAIIAFVLILFFGQFTKAYKNEEKREENKLFTDWEWEEEDDDTDV